MRKLLHKVAISIIVVILIFGTITLITYFKIKDLQEKNNHYYLVEVERSSDENNGLDMIKLAEELDYCDMFNETQRDSGITTFLKDAEGRANFISKVNIDHYISQITQLEMNYSFGQYKLQYIAEARSFDTVELVLKSRKDPDCKNTGLYFEGEYVSFFPGIIHHIMYHNGSDYVEIDAFSPYYSDKTIDIFYNNCSLVEMKMDFSAKPKPDEGGGFEMWQYVIFNQKGDLLFFYNMRIDTGVLPDWMGITW